MAPTNLIDMRSDTVTRPSQSMRDAMARADVGDDVFCEDPTVRRLEEHVAELLGKQAALFVPSGTMGNQIAIAVQTRPGDEILVGQGAHCAWYEAGAASAFWGVQAVAIGQAGLFRAAEVHEAKKPVADWYPRTALVAVENTHNRAGGVVWPLTQLREVVQAAKQQGLRLHMDGARIWNAAVASGHAERELAEGFDTVSVCFSKGLGAPVGSALCGTRDAIQEARRVRKRLGGGMRQAGVLAAAALHALEHHRNQLAQDHLNAQRIAARLALLEAARVDLRSVQTNIVMIDTPGIAAERVVHAAREHGVLVAQFGPERIRVVTHRDVAETAQRGGELLAQAITMLGGAA